MWLSLPENRKWIDKWECGVEEEGEKRRGVVLCQPPPRPLLVMSR